MSTLIRIRTVPLRAVDYAPYGDVVMASPHGEEGDSANQGTARRYDHLAALENLRPDRAKLNISVFRCAPRASEIFSIDILEKHPRSTQLFVPMCATRFLVIVALGSDRPDIATLKAFEARGPQGISYRPGVWHHPMIALDAPTDFACFVHEDGTADDCVVVELGETERRAVDLSF
jgi:ureidoglycolate lyase